MAEINTGGKSDEDRNERKAKGSTHFFCIEEKILFRGS